MKKRTKKQTLLLGEGIHQHTLYGTFDIENEMTDFAEVEVIEESLLKHEHPNGSFGEHKTLTIERGNWVMGKQVEYNPFSGKVERVWD
jgi:hypothetical protein